MAEPRALDTALIRVDGRDLPPDLYGLLRLVRVEESVQLPDAFVLRFDDAHFTLFDRGLFSVGSKVEIALRTESEPLRVTSGDVTAVGLEPAGSARHELVVHGLDRLHRLGGSPKTRTFTSMSDAAIVRAIATEYGLNPQISGATQVNAYVIQPGLTDDAFLRQRAMRLGYDLWVVGDDLHFAPHAGADQSPPALRYGENLVSFRVRFSAADRCDEVVVRGWDPTAKRVIVGRSSSTDPGSTAPAAAAMADHARQAFGRAVRETGRRPVTTQAEADAAANALMAYSSAAGVVLQGEAIGDPRISAGASVALEGVGTALKGSYRVTSVEHVLTGATPYVTRFVCGAKDPGALVDLVAPVPGAQGAPDSSSSAALGAGLVVGQVTNNADPEHLGRVKVKVPTLSADDETAWAKCVAAGAGQDRGVQFVPEVGDEVLVGFEFGDVHRPVVLGGLWNTTDTPPLPDAASGGKVQTRTLKTREGHHLTFVDAPTASITLELKGSPSALFVSEADTHLTGKQKLAVTAQEIEITAQQSLKLHGSSVTISADGDVTVSGSTIKLN